jgi:hypothetical protein
MAATVDAGNPELHARIGTLEADRKRPGPAAAYLVRSLQISAWPDAGAAVYRSLAESLLEAERFPEARAAATEGALKYPDGAAAFLRILARAEAKQFHWAEARRAAALALDRGAAEAASLGALMAECDERIPPSERAAARELQDGGPAWLDRLLADADAPRRDRRAAIDAEFARLLRGFDGVQAVGAPSPRPPARDPAPPGGAPAPAPDPDRYSDDEVTALFLRAQLRAARSLLKSGRADAAAEILQAVLKEHPGRPEAREARDLLDRPGGR